MDHENELFDLALGFVQETKCHVFLTGKAGTGKTTFLKLLRSHSKKSMIVIAPTGIAAINAGGVTMHSFFQLPFKPYIHKPTPFTTGSHHVCTRNELLSKLRFRKEKNDLIRELDLIVVDEVSMMRADHLEAINQVLKYVRKSHEPFGGVQMLFIGDLYQLPPVVVEEERKIIEDQYQSPYFFDAPVMKEASCSYIELKKIYRQNEAHFIHILNRIRNNQMDEDDYLELNRRYLPDFESQDEKYITLTSHNKKAEEINLKEMGKLQGTSYCYQGKIEDEFNVKQLPAEMMITLKVGAQIMFIKNDSSEEKKFYNGKLASVSSLSDTEIEVVFTDSGEAFTLTKEEWKNIQYVLNEESGKIEEKVIGRYIQYPIRPAWAITIHKSQGLTFERAVVDAGSSFAPGQVYVALSRCTHIEGLVLHSRITPASIHNDNRINDFAKQEISINELRQTYYENRLQYDHQKLLDLFRFEKWTFELEEIQQNAYKALYQIPHSVTDSLNELKKNAMEINQVAKKFLPLLHQLLTHAEKEGDLTPLKQRCAQAIPWFSKQLFANLIKECSYIQKHLRPVKSAKPIMNDLSDVTDQLWKRIEKLHSAMFKGEVLAPPREEMNKAEIKPEVPVKAKGNSLQETLKLFREGKSVEEIAALRRYTISTIEKHISDLIGKGDIPIEEFLDEEEIGEIYLAFSKAGDIKLKPAYEILDGRFKYSQLRCALAHLLREGKLKNDLQLTTTERPFLI